MREDPASPEDIAVTEQAFAESTDPSDDITSADTVTKSMPVYAHRKKAGKILVRTIK